jgi:hypothetical protein
MRQLEFEVGGLVYRESEDVGVGGWNEDQCTAPHGLMYHKKA